MHSASMIGKARGKPRASAVISACGRYRYRLERMLDTRRRTASVIMVNPSTANATEDDATIRKLMGFADRLRIGRILVGNLCAYRSRDIKALGRVVDPVGVLNDLHLRRITEESDFTIVAWGANNKLPLSLRDRWQDVMRLINRRVYCWGTCSDGHPRHPLMISYETPLVRWRSPFVPQVTRIAAGRFSGKGGDRSSGPSKNRTTAHLRSKAGG